MIESIITNNILQPRSIYQIGSSTFGFIKNPRDIDILIYSQNTDLHACRQVLRTLKLPYDAHVTYRNILGMKAYPHLLHYAKHLWGQIVPAPDLLNDRTIISDTLNYWSSIVMKQTSTKRLYHIYIILSLLRHHEYQFTDEEIKEINLLHSFSTQTDPAILNQWRHQIYNSILDVAQQYNINLNGVVI